VELLTPSLFQSARQQVGPPTVSVAASLVTLA
jgi:hypothetical protein